jgi:AraC-like DNA-binding protein
MVRGISEEKKNAIIKNWNEGMSIFELGFQFQMETPALKRLLKSANADGKLTRPLDARWNPNLMRIRELIKAHPQGTWTLKQYSEELGISEQTIYSYLYERKDKDGNFLIGWTRPRAKIRGQLDDIEMGHALNLIQEGKGVCEILTALGKITSNNISDDEIKNLMAFYRVIEEKVELSA